MPITFEQIMACHPENEGNFNALLSSMRTVKPFVGAGLSIPPYQTWSQSLLAIADKAASPALTATIQSLLDQGLFEEAATALLVQRGQGRFDQDFVDAFDPKKLEGAALSEALALLPAIWDGAAVTTNFDRALEEAYNRHKNPFLGMCVPRDDDYSVMLDRMQADNGHYLLKLHGDIENFRQRVLTVQEYEALYGDIKKDAEADCLKPFPRMLRDHLKNNRFLFLGCSLDSDRTLQVLQLLSGRGDVHHYAFLELPKDTVSAADDTGAVIFNPANDEKWERLAAKELHVSNHGIFPVWYPYGQHNAVAVLLRRLLEECKNRGIRLLKNRAIPGAAVLRHPHGFFGRDEKVLEVLQTLTSAPVVCVYGAPGIGKSEVCEEVLYRLKKPDTLQKTVYLQGAFGFAGLLGKLGQALNMAPDTVSEPSVLKRLGQMAQEQDTLLYLDNFEDALCDDAMQEQTSDSDQAFSFLEKAETVPGLSVLLSCRKRVNGRFVWVVVQPLQPEFAWELFQQVWFAQGGSAARLEQGKADAEALLRELDYHPLSIVLMASQAGDVPSVRALLEAWRTSRSAEASLSPTPHNDSHQSLRAALRTSYLHIQNDATACTVWGLCSLVPGVLRSDVLCMILEKEETLQPAVQKLMRLNLLAWADEGMDDTPGYAMLAPIKRQVFAYVTGDQPGSEAQACHLLEVFYARLLAAAKPGRDGWEKAHRFVFPILDDILYLLRHLYHLREWNLCEPIYSGLWNYYQLRITEGIRIIEDVMRLYEQGLLPLSALLLAQSNEYYGDLQSRLGHVDEALARYTEAEKLFVSERDNLGRANVLQSMGDLFQMADDLQKASTCYEKALPLYRSEQDSMGWGYTLAELCLVYAKLKRFAEMREAMDEISAILPDIGYTSVKEYMNQNVKEAGGIYHASCGDAE